MINITKSVPYRLSRRSITYFTRWHTFQNRAARANDAAKSDSNARADIAIVGNPAFILDVYRLREYVEGYLSIIMSPGVKIHLMRDRDIISDIDFT